MPRSVPHPWTEAHDGAVVGSAASGRSGTLEDERAGPLACLSGDRRSPQARGARAAVASSCPRTRVTQSYGDHPTAPHPAGHDRPVPAHGRA